MRKLLLEALQGDSRAWRKIGVGFWTVRFCKKNRELAKECLKKAIEEGDEEAYFFYYTKVDPNYDGVDEESYREMLEEYQKCAEPELKKRLQRYLKIAADRKKKKEEAEKVKRSREKVRSIIV